MNLLINESPLQLLPSLAVKIGLNQAIVVQQLYYWLQISKNIRDGHKWVYKTLEDWQKEFPFWSKSTLERTIRKLEEDQLIVVGNYNRLKMDRTKWYRINYEAIDLLCPAQGCQNEEMEDGELEKSKDATCEPPFKQHEDIVGGNLTTPIPINYTKNTSENTSFKLQPTGEKYRHLKTTAFQFYENNGFGLLNPYVAEKVGGWMDDLNEELVLFAMQTAIENNVPKWSYVESVLRDWQQKQLQSVADAKAYKQSFTTKKQAVHSQKRTEIIPDWFHKRHEQSIAVENTQAIDFEAERKKILERLKAPSTHTMREKN